MKKGSSSLLKKAVFAIALILLPISVVFLHDYFDVRDKLINKEITHNRALAEGYEGMVFMYFEKSKRRAEDFSTDGMIRNSLQDILDGKKGLEKDLRLYLSSNKQPIDKTIYRIDVASTDGRIVASTEGPEAGKLLDPSIRKGEERASVSYLPGGASNKHSIIVSTPILSRTTGRQIGFIVNYYRLLRLDLILKGEYLREYGALSSDMARNGTVRPYIVDREGYIVSGRFEDAIPAGKVDMLPVRECRDSKRELTGLWRNYAGVDVIGASMCIPVTGWTLIVEIEVEKALEETNKILKNALVLGIVIIGFILLLGFLFFRKVVVPLGDLSKAAESVAGGDYNLSLPVASDDEIGELTRSFNLMAGEIKKRSEAERHARQAEEERLMMQERFEELVNNLPIGIYRNTPGEEGRFLEVNPALVKMLEAGSKEEILSRNVSNFYVDRERRKEVSDKILRQGFLEDEEVEAVTLKGNRIWVSISSVAKRDDKGEIYFDGIVENITERKKLEDQLLHSQKMEAVGQLAGGIAHDFNNALTAILGFGKLLLMKRGEDETIKNYAQHIVDAGEGAASLVQGILAFSRKQTMVPRPIDISELIENTKKILLRLIGEDYDIKTVISGSPLVVKADAIQIEQVLMNLATNARDAMPGGGTITISVGPVELDELFIRKHGYGKVGHYAMITFADTGHGIDEETTKRIFEPFFTTKEVGKGTGLGLSMVYGVVKQHEGFINVYSEPGEGTVFKIYLPLAASLAGGRDIKEDLMTPGGTETLLLIEDDERVRKVILSSLLEAGYHVMVAFNGEDGISKFKDNIDRIQLCITDMVMPRMGGMETYEGMRKIRPDLKIIFMSGYAGDKTRWIVEKGLDFIPKPVSPTDLLRKVREVLDR